MENIIKTLYFDYKLFVALPFLEWFKLTISKYKCLFSILVKNKPAVFSMGSQNLEVATVGDIGTTISSLSDEYFDLYSVLGKDLKTVVDIGANIGQFTNAIKYWYPSVETHSFEADPETYKTLEKNTKLDGVKIYNKALADAPGKFRFYRAHTSGMSSLIKDSDDQSFIEVEGVTADSLLKDVKLIDLFKIDVEGAELIVLKGSCEVLRRSKYLLIEMSFQRNSGSATNLEVLNKIREISKNATIIHTGRRLGGIDGVTTAQDFLIKLNN